MEDLLINLKIIKDLSKIIKQYLTTSQHNLLTRNYDINIKEIIEYDSKLIANIEIKSYKYSIFELCAKHKKLENMKWSPSRLRRFASRNIAAQCICFAN